MPDAVLLDWNMPVKNGLEFLQELRAMQNGNKPIVVFCATEKDMEHIKTAIEAGANAYIMKPFDSAIIESQTVQVDRKSVESRKRVSVRVALCGRLILQKQKNQE